MASSTPEQKSRTGSTKIFHLGTWKFGERLSQKTRMHSEPEGGDTSEEHGVYEAMRIDPPSETPISSRLNGSKCYRSLFKMTDFWSNRNYKDPSDEIRREIDNLYRLHSCSSTPKLIGSYIGTQGLDDELPGGYIAYIIMQKVPGNRLDSFETLTPGEQNRARIAFINALWEFRSNCFIHSDPRRENLMWNSKTDECFIIDLEDAEHREGLTEDDVCLDPEEELEYWGLAEGRPKGTLFHRKNELMVYMKTEYPVVD